MSAPEKTPQDPARESANSSKSTGPHVSFEIPNPEPKKDDGDKPETDWRAEARKWEARAKENKAAVDKLGEIEESSKSELQKALDRAAVAEKRAAELEAAEKDRLESEARAKEIAGWAEAAGKKHGVPAGLIRGSSSEEINAHAAALAAAMPNRRGAAPREGILPSDGGNELRAFTRQLFTANNE